MAAVSARSTPAPYLDQLMASHPRLALKPVLAATEPEAVDAAASTASNCLSSGGVDDIQALLVGEGAVASLCPGSVFDLTDTVAFTARGQEISTQGYPTDDTRALLRIVNEPTGNLTSAVYGRCTECNNVKLRNIRVDGNRAGLGVVTGGEGLLAMGGSVSGQVVDHVQSSDPRGFTALHVMEGAVNCTGAQITTNELGPSGSRNYGQWGDGISLACANSTVTGNKIHDATDGGIVIFDSPGSHIYNNVISIENYSLLGGINLVDYGPWKGNYGGTRVYNNTIKGGYTQIVKVGIAVGNNVWFGVSKGDVFVRDAVVEGNTLMDGRFGYGAISGVRDFTVRDNTIDPSASFASLSGVNCTQPPIANSTALLLDSTRVLNSTVSPGFENGTANYLVCVQPRLPWPTPPVTTSSSSATSQPSSSTTSAGSGTNLAVPLGLGLGVGIPVLLLVLAGLFWLLANGEGGVRRMAKVQRGRVSRRTPPDRHQ